MTVAEKTNFKTLIENCSTASNSVLADNGDLLSHLQEHLRILDPDKDVADSRLEADRSVRVELNFKHCVITRGSLNKDSVISRQGDVWACDSINIGIIYRYREVQDKKCVGSWKSCDQITNV